MLREDHVAGRGATPNPAREDRRDYSADLSRTETTDPIKRLLDLLDAALARDGAICLPCGRVVRVRPLADGCFGVERHAIRITGTFGATRTATVHS